jgi:UPF0755 protein
MKETKQSTVVGIVVVIFLLSIFYVYQQLYRVPDNFPTGKNFTINENESLKSISERLEEEKFISSPILFRAGISFLGKDTSIQLGGYTFSSPLSLFGVMTTFVQGKPHFPLLSVTIPEGTTSFDIAKIVHKALPGINIDIFGETVSKHLADGKLFPSTYYLLPSHTAEDIVTLMVKTYVRKTEALGIASNVQKPLTDENDVLTLASILEGEANTEVDMKIVAGILLKRMSIGMPLQVDVAMETYKKKGLPFQPINNPGLVAITAVLEPTSSDFLYYITGRDGKMYYSKTFDEHKKNIQKYLK